MKPTKPNTTTIYHLAKTIHEILDVPNGSYGNPTFGFKVIKTILNVMRDALHRGEAVSINGFGTLRVVERTPRRTGSNFVANTASNKRHPSHETNVYSPVIYTYGPRKYIIFEPSIQFMAMINMNTPNAHEQREIAKWNIDEN